MNLGCQLRAPPSTEKETVKGEREERAKKSGKGYLLNGCVEGGDVSKLSYKESMVLNYYKFLICLPVKSMYWETKLILHNLLITHYNS